MNRKLSAFLVAAGCTAAVAVSALAAHATVHTASESTWMVCPDGGPVHEGQLTSVTATDSTAISGTFDISGTITPCHPPTPGPRFAVAGYSTLGALVPGGGYMTYADLGPDNMFTLHITVPRATRALCLVTDPTTRVDCVGLRWPSGGQPSMTDHIPSYDPRVNMPLGPAHGTTNNPNCPTCQEQ